MSPVSLIYRVHISYISCDILSRYYIGSLFGLVVKFGPLVFYLFGPSVKNLVIQFSIYSVLRIWSTVPARSGDIETNNKVFD